MLADLKQLFIVAKVELVKDSSLEEFDSAYIKVEKSKVINVHDVGTILMKMKWKANCALVVML